MVERRILVVDGDKNFVAFLRNLAEGIGYEVEEASDFDGFKQAYSSFRPGVVVLETVMPDLDPLDLLAWTGTQADKPRFVIITGFNPTYAEIARTRAEELHLGPVEIYTKPIGGKQLTEVLDGRGTPSRKAGNG